MIFRDRQDAGAQLAAKLKNILHDKSVIFALPRGGVVVGVEVAKILRLPLRIIFVKKIGHPQHSEYAIGAIAEGGATAYSTTEIAEIDPAWKSDAEMRARALIRKRKEFYFPDQQQKNPKQYDTSVIVDNGIATGFTMLAAIKSLKKVNAKRVMVAAPVASEESIILLKREIDEVVLVDEPKNFQGSVGMHYRHFDQVSDMRVKELIQGLSLSNEKSS